MRHFTYLTGTPSMEDEDLVQEAWCKALAQTTDRPSAATQQELVERYQHIAGLVTHIFHHDKIKSRQRTRVHQPLTDAVGVWYNREDVLEDCTPQQLKAIQFYLSVIDQDRPLTTRERAKLARLRKATGLALTVPKKGQECQR